MCELLRGNKKVQSRRALSSSKSSVFRTRFNTAGSHARIESFQAWKVDQVDYISEGAAWPFHFIRLFPILLVATPVLSLPVCPRILDSENSKSSIFVFILRDMMEGIEHVHTASSNNVQQPNGNPTTANSKIREAVASIYTKPAIRSFLSIVKSECLNFDS